MPNEEINYVTVDHDVIHAILLNFSKIMGIRKANGWYAIFEFTAMIGFEIAGRAQHGSYSRRVASLLEQLEGHHADTIMKAYKAKRYSGSGRVRTFLLKCAHIPMFMAVTVRQLLWQWTSIGGD